MLKTGQVTTDLVRRQPLFASATDTETTVLAGSCRRRTYQKGEVIYHQDDAPADLFIVLSGKVKIGFVLADRHVTLGWQPPGSLIGTMSLVDGGRRQESAIAVEKSDVLILQIDVVRDFLWSHPPAMRYLLELLAARWRGMSRIVNEQVFLNIPGRIAHRLLTLANNTQLAASGEQFIPALSQTELAAMVGATRESVNRWVHEFQRQGMIRIENGGFRIVDPDRLELMLQ